MWRKFLRLLGMGFANEYMDKWFRVSGVDPTNLMPCDMCRKIKPTTIEEVWSNAYPVGRLRRMCRECGEGHA